MSKILEEVSKDWFDENVPYENKDFTEQFLSQAHLSPQTLIQYQSALYQFFKFVHDQCGNKILTDLKPRDALKYQNYLINKGLSSSAVKLKRSAVSSLCGYIELYYSDEYPLFRNIYNKKIPNPPKAFKHKKEPLTVVEYEKLIEELTTQQKWQMLAYVWFTYITGCRREESRQLLKEVVSYEHIKDPKTGDSKKFYMTHEIRAKGRGSEGKKRKFAFDDRAMLALRKWVEERGEDDCEYMFVTKRKNGDTHQLSSSTFNQWCTDVFSKILGRRVHPHLFRSTRATHLVTVEGKNIESAQALLGHESSETTQIYVVKDADEDLDSVFD